MVTPTYTFADGPTVNRLGYGAMRLTGQPGNFGRYPDWDEGKRVLRRAVERGVQHIDTARAYGPGWNEELVAEALHPYPADLLIATKGGIEKNAPAPAGSWLDGSPSALRTHVDESLQRLKLDTIGLYYLHRPDPQVDIAESVGALAELQRAGKIRHIGVSNVSVEQLAAARSVATVAAVQNRFDPINGGDTDVLDVVAAAGIAFVPWGPLGTDPFERVAPGGERGRRGRRAERHARATGAPRPAAAVRRRAADPGHHQHRAPRREPRRPADPPERVTDPTASVPSTV